MYVSKYDMVVIGQKWNDKKDKLEGGHTLVRMFSDEGINIKKFVSLMGELSDAHDGCEIEVSVVMKQRNYDE
jgi:hypothetical protein